MSDEEAVVSGEESRQDVGGMEDKLVPVGEAIRYRKRAQAAEKELLELKEAHDKQAEELAELKEKSLMGEHTGSPLRQGESVAVGTAHPTGERAAVKTQGVKETRTGGARGMLMIAAGRAAESGSRADLQEYLRVRRAYV